MTVFHDGDTSSDMGQSRLHLFGLRNTAVGGSGILARNAQIISGRLPDDWDSIRTLCVVVSRNFFKNVTLLARAVPQMGDRGLSYWWTDDGTHIPNLRIACHEKTTFSQIVRRGLLVKAVEKFGKGMRMNTDIRADGASNLHSQKKKIGLVLAGLIAAVSMTNIDSTVVSVSSQAVQSGLSLNGSDIAWIVNAYMLAAAAAFPLCGHLSDVVGHERIMLLGILLFGVGSLCCGLVPAATRAFAAMIGARVVQGIGCAMMFPSAIGILFSLSASENRAKKYGIVLAITGAMTCLGPILGSYLIQFSWRYIFFINIPLAIIAILMITKLVPSQVREQAHRPIGWRGGIIVALAMIALIIPLQQSSSLGWTNSLVWGACV